MNELKFRLIRSRFNLRAIFSSRQILRIGNVFVYRSRFFVKHSDDAVTVRNMQLSGFRHELFAATSVPHSQRRTASYIAEPPV